MKYPRFSQKKEENWQASVASWLSVAPEHDAITRARSAKPTDFGGPEDGSSCLTILGDTLRVAAVILNECSLLPWG